MLRHLFGLCTEQLPAVPAALVPAEPVLFQTSIRDNICFGEPFSQERLDQVMELTGLKQDFEKDRGEVERSAGKMGAAVSGGQKKRIGIARALYTCMSQCDFKNGVDGYLLFIDGLEEAVDEKNRGAPDFSCPEPSGCCCYCGLRIQRSCEDMRHRFLRWE